MGSIRLAAVVVTGVVLLAPATRLGAGGGTPVESGAVPQAFVSGSTGADGALDLATNCSSPYATDPSGCYVRLPPSGILHYTTVSIPTGKHLAFIKNLQNTPVVMLAQGNVTIAEGGTIDVSVGERLPPGFGLDYTASGPGGFRGGEHQQPGFGPAAGTASEPHAKWVGPLSLVPIIGGSGGYGSGNRGTGGAGAIAIASSGTIVVNGVINANSGQYLQGAGAGAGGAIRLVANAVSVGGQLQAYGGADGRAGQGVIRLEAPLGFVTLSGSASPAAIIAPINPVVVPSAIPALTIVSVGGYPVPTYAGQRFDTVDLLLPMQLPDPINVLVAATNIPVGTQILMSFGTGNTGTVTPGTLAGSNASSQGTVRVSGLNRTQLAYLFVHATFPVATGADVGNPPGPDQVARVQASAPPGGATQFAFLRQNGTRVPDAAVPPQLLKQFRQ